MYLKFSIYTSRIRPKTGQLTSLYISGISYHKVCEKARGYQKDTPDTFGNPRRRCGSQYIKDIDGVYVDGPFIMTLPPRKHVWTYSRK